MNVQQITDFFGENTMAFGREAKDDRLMEFIKSEFAALGQQIQTNGQLISQQSQRIDGIATQMNSLSNQQEAMRTDFNQRWQDLPKLYVPRQEHQAMALDSRTAALEEFRVAATKDIADVKLSLQQQIQAAIQAASKEIVDARNAARDDNTSTQMGFKDRQLVIFGFIFTFLINGGIAIAVRFLGH